MVTFAPAIAAPDGSVMVPDRFAPETCAWTLPAEKIVMAKMPNSEKAAEIFCNIGLPLLRPFHAAPEPSGSNTNPGPCKQHPVRYHPAAQPPKGSGNIVWLGISPRCNNVKPSAGNVVKLNCPI